MNERRVIVLEQKNGTMEEIQALRSFFEDARIKLGEGKIVNLAGVENLIASVCREVQQAPQKQQQIFLPELSLLIELLGSYELELRKIQSEIAKKLESKAGSNDNS